MQIGVGTLTSSIVLCAAVTKSNCQDKRQESNILFSDISHLILEKF